MAIVNSSDWKGPDETGNRKKIAGWIMHPVATYTSRADANMKAVQLRRKGFVVSIVPYGKRWRVYCTLHTVANQQRKHVWNH